MEVEPKKSGAEASTRGRRKRRSRAICCGWVILAILAVGLVVLVLALTVFKAKHPTTTVNSVALTDFHVSLDIMRLRVALNVTLDANLAIENPNRVGFRFDNSTALLKYRGQVVGEVPVPAGKIGARETLPMNITLTLMADRLLSDTNLYSDVASGTLPLSTYIRIAGYVRIIFKIHVVSYTTCDFYVDVPGRRLSSQTCHYRTKI